jgi:hypothetical protein
MKHFKLFEQFCTDLLLNESIEDEIKELEKELSVKNDANAAARKKRNEIQDAYYSMRSKLKDKGMTSEEINKDPDVIKAGEEFTAANAEVTSTFNEVSEVQEKIYKLKQSLDSEESSSKSKKTGSSSKEDDIINALEDKIEDDFTYEFELVPSVQFKKISDGDKDVVNKVKEKIKYHQNSLGELKTAVAEMKIEGDKDDVKYAQARLASAEAEIAIYNACLSQDKKQLAKSLAALAKVAKILDALQDD